LLNGLYAASCGASANAQPEPNKLNTEAAFYQVILTTVDNPQANISVGRAINLLYI